ncbi:glycerophosphodiester phosphodiesterase [Methanocella conradii]|uniref:glycerophosphodiester phosphodiesterase n=1 Tax=Methanocella conradii TaxID=1175444 RepID=UPI0024B365AA|nr:glycerophosphodiester phosphodiesterase family protein [Methanocella conradii]MDI6897355.1 glycerophosphodiester phosphodiesterase family protein [Methanocella conradii]
MYYFEIVGHRGAPGQAPENTLLSFERAIRTGVDWIELDVRRSRDGVLVVIHDEMVDRTTDGSGRVSDMGFGELERLDAGAGQRIPSLQQVVDLAKGRVKMDIEIKEKGIEEDVVNTIKKNGIESQCMVSSFSYGSIKKVKELCPRLVTAAIMDEMPEDVEKYMDTLLGVDTRILMLSKKIVTEPFIGEARRLGFSLGIWNADTTAEIERYAAMDPEYLCSNYPEMLVEFRQAHSII